MKTLSSRTNYRFETLLKTTPSGVVFAFLLSVLCCDLAVAGAKTSQNESGTLETMMVANATVVIDVDAARLTNHAFSERTDAQPLRFIVGPDSFFKIVLFNKAVRGAESGSLTLIPQNKAAFLDFSKAVGNQLVLEKGTSDDPFDLAIRDRTSGLVMFNIEGHEYDYDAARHLINVTGGRLVVSQDLAMRLGHDLAAGMILGDISLTATLYPIEVQKIVNGAVTSGRQPANGTVPGPDVIVGDISAMVQAGTPNGGVSGNFVGLGIGTTACNAGTEDVNWFPLPSNDHPVIAQSLYRMSGGTDNTERIEQIGQSWMKHTYTTFIANICGYGCNGVSGSSLGSGCSDVYTASLNNNQSILGSRAWVNPFTGYFPGTNPDPDDHSDHRHSGTSHRVTVAISDLDPAMNAGATYFAEGQYVVPHEYTWCQSHAGQCNMFQNVSYRHFVVTSLVSPFTFAPAGPTQRMQSAIQAWTGATISQFEPDPGNDGIGFVGFKVTNPTAGVWHYEYAVYNENLDRAIQSFSVPLGCGVNLTNLGFYSPPQEPGWSNDGTQNSAGYSHVPWASNQTINALTWSCETFAQNQNSNAIRWGTLYNFRFDSDKPPQAAQATIGFFKMGSPVNVSIQAPAPNPCNPLAITSVVSRKTHGPAGDFDVNLPLSDAPGVECRSGGTNGDHTFVFSFTNEIVAGNTSVTSGIGAVSGAPSFSGNTMTVNVTTVADDQQITVTGSNVTDIFGQTMPDVSVPAVILMGDTTGSKTVNSSDVIQTKLQAGAAVDYLNFRNDVNFNGNISASDASAVKSQVGKSVP